MYPLAAVIITIKYLLSAGHFTPSLDFWQHPYKKKKLKLIVITQISLSDLLKHVVFRSLLTC